MAQERALELALDRRSLQTTPLAMLQTMSDAGEPRCIAGLLRLIEGDEPEVIQLTALTALRRRSHRDGASALLSDALGKSTCQRR